MILVVGASGLLGGTTARLLLSQGRGVRVLGRSAARLEPFRALGAEVVVGDLLDPASLRRACSGVQQVFTTANSFTGRGATSPERVDGQGNRNLVDTAEDAGVTHFVFTSSFNLDELSAVDYFEVKLASDRYVRASAVPWTVLRPTAFMDIWAAVIGEPVLAGKPARIVGHGRRLANYICVEDVAAMVPLVLDDARSRGAVVEFGGPERLSPLQIVEIFERIAGRPATRQHSPPALIKTIATLLRPFNPVLARQLALAALTQADETSLDMGPVLARYPIPQTRFEDWARRKYAGGAQGGSKS